MMVVMLSSSGASWAFYATAGDKVFLVETAKAKPGMEDTALSHMVRECRWMFGDRRIIFLDATDDWMEVLRDGTGTIRGYEPYDGPIPVQTEEESFQ